MRRLATALQLPLILTLSLAGPVGCDDKKDDAKSGDDKGDKGDGKDDGGDAAKEAEVKDPATLFAKGPPDLPGPLAKLKWGMPEEEVKKAAPELEDGYSKAKEYKDTYFGYYCPEDTGKLQSMRVVVEAEGADLEKILTAAWGAPKKGEDLGKPKLFWFNPDKKIRATIQQGFGKEKEVQFEPYLPYAELLGEGKETLGFEVADKPLLGASYDDLQKHYGQWLEGLSKEEAEKQRKQIEKMTGKDLSALGDAVASTNIDLHPTEFGSSFTRVHPKLEEGKITEFRVGIDWEPFPAAKDEIFEAIKGKWGAEPKEEEDLGRKQFVFNDKPKVVVREDTITKKWDIIVEAAE